MFTKHLAVRPGTLTSNEFLQAIGIVEHDFLLIPKELEGSGMKRSKALLYTNTAL